MNSAVEAVAILFILKHWAVYAAFACKHWGCPR